MFEPYFTNKRTGTGLGLAITKNIVQSLGGSIRLSSDPVEGTEVKIELPSARVVDPSSARGFESP